MTQETKYKDILDTFSDSFPLLEKVYQVYEKTPQISEDQENTLRRSIEMTTLETLELIVVASRQSIDARIETLRHANNKLDTLKVFVDLATQTDLIDKKIAESMSESIQNVGKMIGGWLKKSYEFKKEATK